MKVSFTPVRLGLVILGTAALAGAAVPVRADGSTVPSTVSSFGEVEGLVVAATDASSTSPGTLTVHPAAGGDLVLTVTPNTHFRKAGGELDTPDALTGSGTPPVATSPSPTWFVGLYARGTYDKTNSDAVSLVLSRPEPVLVSGTVDSVVGNDLTLDVKGGSKLDLTLGPQTCVRLDGLPSTGDKLVAGDLANAMYWPTASDNEALSVDARTPPPLHFEGVLTAVTTDAGGAFVGFSATHGNGTPVSFQPDANTVVRLDGKSVPPASLQMGDSVNVAYRVENGVNDPLTVTAFSPRPAPQSEPPTTTPNNDPKVGPTGSGDQGSTGGSNTGAGSGKVPSLRPRIFNGVVASLDATGLTFTASHGSTTLTFSTDAKTRFLVGGQTAAFTDLQQSQRVEVIYQPSSGGGLALVVVGFSPAGGTSAHP